MTQNSRSSEASSRKTSKTSKTTKGESRQSQEKASFFTKKSLLNNLQNIAKESAEIHQGEF